MKLILFLLRSSPRVVIVAITAGLIAGISNTGLLTLINANLNQTGTAAMRSAWLFAALAAVMLISRYASSIALTRLARGAIFDLRMQLCRRIIAAPLRHLEEVGAARLMATLTDDVPTISLALTSIPLLCMHLAVVVTCLIYLAWLSWTVFLGVAVFMAFGILSYYIPSTRALRYMHASRQGWDLLSKHLQALMQGTKELKLHWQRQQAFFTQSLEATADATRRDSLRGDYIYAFISGWGQLLVFALIGVLLFVAPTYHIDRQTLIGYSLLVLYIMTPLEVLLNLIPSLGRANIAIRKVEELGLSLQSQVTERHDARLAPHVVYESLELRSVTHDYRREGVEETFIFGPIDLSFRPAEVVFLVGGNGSGKTTLAKLLTGLYVPKAGEVLLNGEVVTDETREKYRQLFSAVFSDFYLFDTLLGLNDQGLDAQSRYYLSYLQLEHKVRVVDGKLSTTDLSQGQRKRLALMTAYLEDRPFYVFDEWAADQDPYFKEIFYLQLLPELKAKGKTVLVISHDDRYYYMADRIIKLDYGKVVSESSDAYSEAVTANVA
jgi:putative ATP-binding cassette transporter